MHKGYCEYVAHQFDGRYRVLKLTKLGLKQLKEIHNQATQQVTAALVKLSKVEQEIVTQGLSLYATALKKTPAIMDQEKHYE